MRRVVHPMNRLSPLEASWTSCGMLTQWKLISHMTHLPLHLLLALIHHRHDRMPRAVLLFDNKRHVASLCAAML